MKKLSLVLVATTLMSLSVASMADDHGWKDRGWHGQRWDERREWREERRADRREWREDRRDWRDDRRELRQERRWDQRERWYNAEWRSGRYGRGDRLPYAYRNSRYYVNDWRAYRLYTPPRGSQWLRINNDFLLVSLADYLIYATR